MGYLKIIRRLLPFIAGLYSVHATAQYKRVPDINHERNEVNTQILKGHYKGYNVYDFELFPDKTLDTTLFSEFRFYPSGLLKEVQQYSYAKWEEIKDLEYWRKLGRYQNGMRKSFTYDDKGNIRTVRSTMLYPRNSYAGLLMLMMKDRNSDVRPNVDSLLTVGVAEQSAEREVITYKYDKDGNPVSSVDSVEGETTIYKYTYDKDKRVTMQRRTTYEVDRPREKTVTEFYFGYDNAGNQDSIKAYRSFMDTVNVVSDRNRQYMIGRIYNARGKVVKEYSTSQSSGAPTETTFTYSDTLISGSLIVKKGYSSDTDAISENRYDEKGRPVEEKKIVFYDGKRRTYNRVEFTYDDAGNVTEIRYYSREAAATKEQMIKKTVFVLY